MDGVGALERREAVEPFVRAARAYDTLYPRGAEFDGLVLFKAYRKDWLSCEHLTLGDFRRLLRAII